MESFFKISSILNYFILWAVYLLPWVCKWGTLHGFPVASVWIIYHALPFCTFSKLKSWKLNLKTEQERFSCERLSLIYFKICSLLITRILTSDCVYPFLNRLIATYILCIYIFIYIVFWECKYASPFTNPWSFTLAFLSNEPLRGRKILLTKKPQI